MKKMMMTLIAMLTMTVSANAMSFEQARNEALFLTDKMAYELNLTDEQYEAAYEINLDYLMGVTGRADVFGPYWERRNLDLSYILLDWQWEAFLAATYFYRPLYWEAGYWHFGIYARYPHRDYFYFGRPHFYATYRGGHAWHMNGGRSFYVGRRDHFRSSGASHFGMHDRWNRGDFRGGRPSSTRITAGPNHNGRFDNGRGGRIEGNRGGRIGTTPSGRIGNTPSGRYDNNRGGRSYEGSRNGGMNNRSSVPSRNFGSDRSSMPSRSFGNGNSSPSRSFGTHNSASSRSYGSQNSSPSRSYGSSTPSRSYGSSTPSRSFGNSGGGSRSFGGSHSGGMHSGGSHGGGSHGGGGGHFGGRR